MQIKTEYEAKKFNLILAVPEKGKAEAKFVGFVELGDMKVGINEAVELTDEENEALNALMDKVLERNEEALMSRVHHDLAVTMMNIQPAK